MTAAGEGSENRLPAGKEPNDLGFGAKIPTRNARLLNHDGSFNVERKGVPLHVALNFYHLLTSIGWTAFILVVLGGYLAVNTAFSLVYMALGVEHLVGHTGVSEADGFFDAFFFSAQTLTTVGYGRISPDGVATSMVAALESLAGLMGFALATGLLYSRFARARSRLLFSQSALIAPYRGGTAFMFRFANARNNQLIETEAEVSLSWVDPRTGTRNFLELPLERSRIQFFPLSWTIVHPIDEASPLRGMTAEDFRNGDGEFFVHIKAYDDAFGQTVYVRHSYRFDEIVYGAKFAFIFERSPTGGTTLDLRRLNEHAPADLPAAPIAKGESAPAA
jgi:inward rectifier potassium channel